VCEASRRYNFCTTIRLAFRAFSRSNHVFQGSCGVLFVSLALYYRTSSWPNGTSTSTSTSDVHISAAYNLIDTYDASNWLNKFNVQAVSDLPLRYILSSLTCWQIRDPTRKSKTLMLIVPILICRQMASWNTSMINKHNSLAY
jgi:hypothetical protein